MKKIIIIQQTGVLGGSGISLYQTVNMLKDLYEVVVYCPAYPSDLTNYLREKNIKVKNFDFQIGSISYYSGGPKFLSRSNYIAAKKILQNKNYWEEILISEKADFVAVNSLVLSWMSIIFKEINIKSICFIRETIPSDKNIFRNAIMKNFLNDFTAVAFLSNYDLKKYDLKNTISVVIRDCISIDKAEQICFNMETKSWPWEFEKKKLNLLFVGGNDPIKGLHIILKALNDLSGLSCQVLVAGYSPLIKAQNFKRTSLIRWWRERYSRKIKKLLNKKVINEKVKILGHQKEMSIVFKSCDILIFPSTVPHQSRPAFEIGVYAKPVIISDFSQTKEYIINEKNGLVFKPNCHKDLADKIKWFYFNDKEIKNYGEQNLNMTKEFHSFKKEKIVLLNLLEKM